MEAPAPPARFTEAVVPAGVVVVALVVWALTVLQVVVVVLFTLLDAVNGAAEALPEELEALGAAPGAEPSTLSLARFAASARSAATARSPAASRRIAPCRREASGIALATVRSERSAATVLSASGLAVRSERSARSLEALAFRRAVSDASLAG